MLDELVGVSALPRRRLDPAKQRLRACRPLPSRSGSLDGLRLFRLPLLGKLCERLLPGFAWGGGALLCLLCLLGFCSESLLAALLRQRCELVLRPTPNRVTSV